MRNTKGLLIDQMDQKLKPFKKAGKIPIPDEGWIKAIRTTLNMTLKQLAAKLHVDYQSVQGYEERELSGKVTLQTMKEVGEAMDMAFVYGFVPNDGSLDKMLDRKAHEMAKKIVLRTHTNMLLEDQATGKRQVNQAISTLAEDLKRDLSKSLWN